MIPSLKVSKHQNSKRRLFDFVYPFAVAIVSFTAKSYFTKFPFLTFKKEGEL